jgi:hypothetical protein
MLTRVTTGFRFHQWKVERARSLLKNRARHRIQRMGRVGRAAAPWCCEGIRFRRRALFHRASLRRSRRSRPSPLLRLALWRNSSPRYQSGFFSRLLDPRANTTRQSSNPKYSALPADRANARTERKPWSQSCGHRQRETRPRPLTPMSFAETVTFILYTLLKVLPDPPLFNGGWLVMVLTLSC